MVAIGGIADLSERLVQTNSVENDPEETSLHRSKLTLAGAVGMRVTSHPPHRSVRAAFPHTVPTLGIHGNYVLPYASQHL